MYYDKSGQKIGIMRMAKLFEDRDYQVVEQTHIGDYLVSTVWLGIDHNFGFGGPPVIFETMVFKGRESDLECRRYSTEDEAREGHAAVVNEVSLLSAI